MKIILLIAFLVPFASHGQWKKLREPYTASNGITYRVGDTLRIGTGSAANGNFMFIRNRIMTENADDTMLDQFYAGTKAIVQKVYAVKLIDGTQRVAFEAKLGKAGVSPDLRVNIENAINACEVLPCPNQERLAKAKDDDKYDKLKKLKGLLDEGVITQEEFDTEKKKILDEN